LVSAFGAAEARTWRVAPGPEAQRELQHALSDMESGDTLRLDRGRYELTQSLTLAISEVTIRGDGQDRTILSFAGQQGDSAGLTVTGHAVELRDFAVEDTRGDAITIRDCNGLTVRALRTEWTRGPNPQNGAYGIHPINCSNVLIEDSIARGAAGAGIGVTSSRNTLVRRNVAERNVTGIAIENAIAADVTENTTRANAIGIAVLNAPGQPQPDGHGVRVFANIITENDAPNIAPPALIFADMPGGAGVVIMAARDTHVFDNEIGGNDTVNVYAGAYRGEGRDAAYSPIPRDIMIRDNRFGATGVAPAGDYAPLVQAAGAADVIWDGADTYYSPAGPRTQNARIVMRDNRAARGGIGSFLSLGLNVAGAPFSEAAPSSAYPPLLNLPEPERVRID
jgi:parallel beta-helix repeat protein